MAMLLVTEKKAYKIPECVNCEERMIPVNLDMEKLDWKCPQCTNFNIKSESK